MNHITINRLILRKALKFVNRGDQQSFKKYLRRIYKRPSMEILNDYFFQFSAKIMKSFVLSR